MGRYSSDLRGANVVCRQLGYKGAVAVAWSWPNWRYYWNPKRRWMHNINCIGSEKSLTNCDHIVSPRACSSYNNRESETCVVCITGIKTDKLFFYADSLIYYFQYIFLKSKLKIYRCMQGILIITRKSSPSLSIF